MARLVREAGGRALVRLEAEARSSEESAVALSPTVGWLKLTLEQLPDVEASNRLVPWLVQWGQHEA
jgi:hypothetical protein